MYFQSLTVAARFIFSLVMLLFTLNSQAASLDNSKSTSPAPLLLPVQKLEINPKYIKRDYSHRNGLRITDLLSYIENLYEGRQFSTKSTEFHMNNSNFGIAITHLELPDTVSALLSINGDQFLYPLNGNKNSGLSRLLEPHQRISFQSYNYDERRNGFKVKIRFRLWDLREREQISPFQWYRIDKVGGKSPFSKFEQEVTFQISEQYPVLEKPFWSHKTKALKRIPINLRKEKSFQMKITEILRMKDGELSLRDKFNRRLGLKITNWNSPLGQFSYRFDESDNWTSLAGPETYIYLSKDAEIRIIFDEDMIKDHNKLHFYGWDGTQGNWVNHLTGEPSYIQFNFSK